MLGSIRKFSTSIYAKILLGIVVIPFVFWGMGTSFVGGNKNILVVIENEKYPIEDFINFIQRNSPPEQKFNDATIENFLSAFIGEKLIESEIENFGIILSDDSLAKLIKHQKDFKRENDFSRLEYEKFLLKNNITAAFFEQNLSMQEKKKQLLDFIGGGILPSNFLASLSFDKINQKRNIELINLNEIFSKKVNFSEDDIKSYFDNNKDNFKEVYKYFKLLELTPKKLVSSEEFSDLFFKKIDEIDDSVIGGKNLDFIIEKYNLDKAKSFIVNDLGKNINPEDVKFLNEDLIKTALTLNEVERTILIENNNKYFILEFEKAEDVQKDLDDSLVKKQIVLNLEKNIKRKFLSEIISKINNKKFTESDFYSLSRNENVPIKKIFLESITDDKILKKEIINQVYSYPQNKVIIVNDIGLTEVYLVYIDKVENVTIDENSEEYEKYLNLSRARITSNLFNTYDTLIKRKYEIDVNEQALEAAKNYLIN